MDGNLLMPRFGTQLFIATASLALFLDTFRIVSVWVETAR